MNFLAPIYFSMSALLAGLLLLYLFRKRYTDQIVPSSLLWEQVMREQQATTWWKKLQRNLLFFLQFVILTLLIFALARPFLGSNEIGGEHLVMVLDPSATMTSKNKKDESLFQSALDDMEDTINHLDSSQRVSIILAGAQPSILIANEQDKRKVKGMMRKLEPTFQSADLPKAIKYAGAMLAKNSGEIIVYTEGFSKSALKGEVMAAPLTIQNYEGKDDNLSLKSFGTAESGGTVKGAAQISNQSSKDREVTVRIEHEGEVLKTIKQTIKKNSEVQISLDNLPIRTYYKAAIDSKDSYEADNAQISFPSIKKDPTIYAVGNVNSFVAKALSHLGKETIQVDKLSDIENTEDGIFILENIPEKDWPKRPSLILSPAPGGSMKVSAKKELREGLKASLNDPLLQYVDLSKVYIQSSFPYTGTGLDTVVSSGETKLISKGLHNGVPLVVLGFDIKDTDWPLHTSFPIFLYNALDYLTEREANIGYLAPGDKQEIASLGSRDKATVVNEEYEVMEDSIIKGGYITAPSKPGLYRITENSGGEKRERLFAVSLDDREKEMAGAKSFKVNPVDESGKRNSEERPNEIWPWLVLIGLVILSAEWEVYRRGISI